MIAPVATRESREDRLIIDTSRVEWRLKMFPADIQRKARLAIAHLGVRVDRMVVHTSPDVSWSNTESEDGFEIEYEAFHRRIIQIIDIEIEGTPRREVHGAFFILRGKVPYAIPSPSRNTGPSCHLSNEIIDLVSNFHSHPFSAGSRLSAHEFILLACLRHFGRSNGAARRARCIGEHATSPQWREMHVKRRLLGNKEPESIEAEQIAVMLRGILHDQAASAGLTGNLVEDIAACCALECELRWADHRARSVSIAHRRQPTSLEAWAKHVIANAVYNGIELETDKEWNDPADRMPVDKVSRTNAQPWIESDDDATMTWFASDCAGRQVGHA